MLWTFQTGFQIAAGPSVYSVGGKQYIAITVGGTPTSSNGGQATRIQVFALDGSKQQSPPPTNLPPLLRQTAGSTTPPATLLGSPLAVATPARTAAPRRCGVRRHDPGRRSPVRPTLAGDRLERADRRRAPAPPRCARPRRADPRRPLPAPQSDGRAGTLPLPRRRDDAETARDRSRRGIERHCARAPALECGAQRRARSERRDQRRLPHHRGACEAARKRQRARHRTRNARPRDGAASGRPLHLLALRQDHGLGRAARAERGRRHPHARPRLLDVLGAERRAGQLQLVLHRVRRGRCRPGAAPGPGDARGHVVRVPGRPKRLVQTPPQRDPGHQAADRGRADDLVRRRFVRRGRVRRAADRRRERRPNRPARSRPPGPTRRAGSGSCCRRRPEARPCRFGWIGARCSPARSPVRAAS